MSKPKPTLSYTKGGKKSLYVVTATDSDGSSAVVGTVKRFYARHIEQYGWEATGADGHRGVHEHRWQAGEALIANLASYPFPILRRAA